MPNSSVDLDLCGIRLKISAENKSWIDMTCAAMMPFVVPQSPRSLEPDFSATIGERAGLTPAAGMPLTWQGTQTDGNEGRIYETDSRAVLEVKDGGFIIIDHLTRTAQAHFCPGAFSKFFGTPIMLMVDAALAAGNQELIHAACLVDRQSGRGVLICAPSGGGKTTTALALARKNFALVTDDASVLVPGDPAPKVWGLPRALKVHRNTAKMLPWLGPLEDRWDEMDEQGIPLESLESRINIAPPKPIELAGIVQLGPREPADHRITPMGKADLLLALAHENVAWRPAGMVPKATRKFSLLAGAVRQVPAWLLQAGPDMASLPDVLSDAMRDRGVSGR